MIDLIYNLDFAVLDFIQENLRCRFLDMLMPPVTLLGNGGIMWIIIALALTISKKHRRAGIIMIAGLIVCLLTGNILLKNAIERLRPFIQNPEIQLLIPPPSGFSFPSGHSFSSFISAVILSKYNRRLAPAALITASLIAFSRIYLYVHFPTDILCGAALGIILGIAVYKLCVRYIPFCAEEKKSENGETAG